jgi:hypothetical protein
MEKTLADFMDQATTTAALIRRNGELEEENRKLKEEVFDLSVLARLATVISFMERGNARQHKELLEADRKYDKLIKNHAELIEWSARFLALKEQSDAKEGAPLG